MGEEGGGREEGRGGGGGEGGDPNPKKSIQKTRKKTILPMI